MSFAFWDILFLLWELFLHKYLTFNVITCLGSFQVGIFRTQSFCTRLSHAKLTPLYFFVGMLALRYCSWNNLSRHTQQFSMWSHAWGPFQFGIFPLESLCTRFSQAKLSPPDRVDVPPDRTDHHLDELHDHGRLRLPLHLRDRLHQLHPVHGVHLRRVRRGQANKIFKPFCDRWL